MPRDIKSSSLLQLFLTLGLFVFAAVIFPSRVEAATPIVNVTPTPNATSVPKFSKFELTFNINKSYASDSRLPYYYYDPDDTPQNNTLPNRTSPYGVDGITINTVFISPTGKTLTVPSFYYQDYIRTRVNEREVLTPNGGMVWKTRFTPSEVGEYRYYISIQDKEGQTRYPTTGELKFNSTNSSAKGFIRPSIRDPRFFDYEDGSSYIPISGYASQWWNDVNLKSYYFEDKFAKFKQAGINLIRLWDENDGYNISFESTYDRKPSDADVLCCSIKGSFVDQPDAFREDKIFESAEANGIAIELSFHEDVYWTWDASVFNEGWNPNPVAFDNKYHVNYYKRAFRNRLARYGYSTSLLTWESWNELGHVAPNSAIWKFHEQYSAYQRSTDPYKHPITTSQGSQTYSPGFWSSNLNDVANYHDYMMPNRYDASLANDEVNFVYRFSQCLRYTSGGCGLGLGDGTTWTGGPKPWIWGEIGVLIDWNGPDPAGLNGEGGVRARVNEVWAGLFGPLGTVPIEWNVPDSSTMTRIYQGTKVASDFFKGIDYNGLKFDHLPTNDISIANYVGDKLVSSSPNNMRAMGLRSQDKKTVLLWAQNKAYTWKNYATTPTAVSGNITVPGITTGTYRVEYWNTETGEITKGAEVTANGNLVVPVSNLQKSVAIKVTNTNGTSLSAACLANQDDTELVDISDYSILVSNFFRTTSFGKSDINKDGIVDISDYSLLVGSFFQVCQQ